MDFKWAGAVNFSHEYMQACGVESQVPTTPRGGGAGGGGEEGKGGQTPPLLEVKVSTGELAVEVAQRIARPQLWHRQLQQHDAHTATTTPCHLSTRIMPSQHAYPAISAARHAC